MKTFFVLFLFSLIWITKSKKLNDDWYMMINEDGHHSSIGKYTALPMDSYSLDSINPLYDKNDLLQRWIGNSTVYLSANFLLENNELNSERIILIFHGIDTFGIIKLNGKLIGKTNNMFNRYVFDVKPLLRTNQNRLSIELESPIKKAKDAFKEQSKNYIVQPECVPSSYNGECHVNHIRKMQASFAWDWGPAIPTSGIWRDVEIISIKDAIIMDETVDVSLKDNEIWNVNVSVALELASSNLNKPINGKIEALLIVEESPTFLLITNSTNFSISSGVGSQIISVVLYIPKSKVERWWPNGYGIQKLYKLNISLVTPLNTETKTKRIGFRTVELIQEPLKNGMSFYFKINNIPIFAKGSNMIPSTIFPTKSTNETLREHLLRFTKEANMNMLRIWGGGIYETDYFYDIADEYGIMIWQDFMFACSMYPTTDDFLNSVKTEVEQNVWRLKSHASVVIWAGNNENEAALYGNWYDTGDKQIYRDDYIKLYVDVIKKLVEKLDSTRAFIVSSPTNGKHSDETGYVTTDPYSTLYGDIHYYNYLSDGWDINTYRCPRFASEYGFQSYPSFSILRSVSRNPKLDLVLDSDFLNHRQHLTGGNSYMKLLINKNLNIPNTNNSQQDLENYIYLSQINQAQSVKVQSEYYRQTKSSLNDAGEGNTMGALYWQLNDVWPAPSWSSIDFSGKWKLLHHFAEEFFDSVIISPRIQSDETLGIFIVSDLMTKLENCIIDVNVHKVWNIVEKTFYTLTIPGINVEANQALHVKNIDIKDLMKNASCVNNGEQDYCIIELILKDQNGKKLAPVNYAYPLSPKNFTFPECELAVTIDVTGVYHNKHYSKHRVTIKSTCTQLFVRFDAGGYFIGRFSENGFHMLRSRKKLFFYIDHSERIGNIFRAFSVVSLGQIYKYPMLTNSITLN